MLLVRVRKVKKKTIFLNFEIIYYMFIVIHLYYIVFSLMKILKYKLMVEISCLWMFEVPKLHITHKIKEQ